MRKLLSTIILLAWMQIFVAHADTLSPDSSISAAPDGVRHGLLLLGIRAFAMNDKDQVSSDPAVVTALSLKNMKDGTTYNVFLDYGAAIVELPPGDYCIATFKTYENIPLEYCSKPVYSIYAGEVLNAGVVIMGVNYAGKPDKIRYRVFDSFASQRDFVTHMTEAQKKVIKNYLTSIPFDPTDLTGSTWYTRNESGVEEMYLFLANGIVEIYDAEGHGADATWKETGNDVIVNHNKGYAISEGHITGGVINGLAHNIRGDSWTWYLSRDVSDYSAFRPGAGPRLFFQAGMKYPDAALKQGVEGFVKIHYTVPLPRSSRIGLFPTVNPSDMKVVDSDPSKLFNDSTLQSFWSSRFINASEGKDLVASEGETTIYFKLNNGVPEIRYSPEVEPAPPADTAVAPRRSQN